MLTHRVGSVGRLVMSVVAAAGIAASLHALPRAQARATSAPQQPRFRVATNLVMVDVYVTRDGRPVTDLTAKDFELIEDDTPQTVATFEHITQLAPTSAATRVEASNVAAANQRAADLSTRVFVLFLDTYHVEGTAALHVRQPLINLLDRLVSQNDLVAVMTPEMSAKDLTFTTRTESMEAILARHWDWGRRGQLGGLDPQENQYEACFVGNPLVRQMIERRREKLTLEALRDLVVHLEGLREGRKPVVVISDGWQLFREDRSMLAGDRSRGPGIVIGPGGRPGVATDPRGEGLAMQAACDRDRAILALLDNEREFRLILDEANRANVSLYPVDPRGLPASDFTMGASSSVSPARDAETLRRRLDALQTMAYATDGVAVINDNNLNRGLQRIADDLTSYYLLGYYSTNTKLDGKFRKITVRVKQPRVDVRARRGYRAPSEADLAVQRATGRAADAAVAPPQSDAAVAVTSALAALAVARANVPVRYEAGYTWRSAAPTEAGQRASEITPRIWVSGELDPARATEQGWLGEGAATVTLMRAGGKTIGTVTVPLSRTQRAFRVWLPETANLDPGRYDVRISTNPGEGREVPVEMLQVSVPAGASAEGAVVLGQPALSRRGPFTGPTFLPAADLRFRRQEWLRVEVSAIGAIDTVAATLLDRAGRPLPIPVTASQRPEGVTSSIWADVALAPLAPGDYLIAIEARQSDRTARVLTAFRVIP